MLSEKLSLPFFDADDFHPMENIEKMRQGQPLNDSDRISWLRAISTRIVDWDEKGGGVLACSALKEYYRQVLVPISSESVQWIVLHGTKEMIKKRISGRKDHFFGKDLIDSQFEIFQIPNYGWHFNIEDSSERIVTRILEKLDYK